MMHSLMPLVFSTAASSRKCCHDHEQLYFVAVIQALQH